MSTDPEEWGALDESDSHDINSIIHYSCYAFGDLDACLESKDWYPLVEIKRDSQGKEIGVALIPMPVQPSYVDIEWVKRNYCWPGDGICKS